MSVVIGMLGGGVVGGGVVELLKRSPEIKLKYILVSDATKKRDFVVPESCQIITDYKVIVNDEECNTLVDAMGGVDLAWTIMKECMVKGMNVVSANKAVLATKLSEIDSFYSGAGSSGKKGKLFFEAAVAGGVPIIAVMRRSLTSDDVTKVGGILNGTTNFILTDMSEKGTDYADVLKEAQANGYAEADPTADVEGIDAKHKLVLLARIAFGVVLPLDEVPTTGITGLIGEDFKYADMCGCTIKLLAESEQFEEDGTRRVRAFVSPVLIPKSHPLAQCSGVMNEAELYTANLRRIACNGPGAGRYATANSVVADLIDLKTCLQGGDKTHPFDRQLMPDSETDTSQRLEDQQFYIRLSCREQVGVIADLAQMLVKYGVSIHSVLQTPIKDYSCVPFAVITEKTSSFNVNLVIDEVRGRDWLVGTPIALPYRGQ